MCPFFRINAANLARLLIVTAELASRPVRVYLLIDFTHSVTVIAEVPSDKSVHKPSQAIRNSRVLAVEDGDNLLGNAERIARELLQPLGES